MPASRDPRSYVKPVPLPVPSCKGVRLLARDTFNFNPEEPSREDVRKNNYYRRQAQMSQMGFKSLSHKPYCGIGDPFYLDEKKMILHALGQWNEEEVESSASSDESEEEDTKNTQKQSAFTAAKFVLRRSRKDLNTLNKAVVHGRNMIRNVSLGHGLFDLISKEKQSKKVANEIAFRKRQEMLRNEFQPPKTDSGDETDEDIENDVDLANYMVPVTPPTFMTQQQTDLDEELGIVNDNASDSDQSPEREPEIKTFSSMAIAEEEEEYLRARSAAMTSAMTSTFSRPDSSRKRKQQTPRPYTPQHTNLSTTFSAYSTRESVTDTDQDQHELDVTKDALFRQLCVLHWILEAMSMDPPSVMTPIMSCWSLADIGGSRVQPKKLQKDKSTESNWANFKETGRKVAISPRVQTLTPKNANVPKVSKRLSSHRLGTRSPHGKMRLHAAPTRNSTQSSATGSQQGSTTDPRNDAHSVPPSQMKKLASLLKPKSLTPLPRASPVPPSSARQTPTPTLGGASMLGQLLELKIKGGLNTLTSQMAMLVPRGKNADPEPELSPQMEEEEDQAYNKSIFKFLDEYYESLKQEEAANKKEDDNKSNSSSQPGSPTPDKKKEKRDERNNRKSKKKREDGDKQDKRLDHKVAVALGEEEKMSSKFLRANAHLIRPKSSPALIEFQNSLPSNKKVTLRTDLHNQFAECREEKALTLHDILEHKEGQQHLVCQSKFVSLTTAKHGSSFHRAVEEMRSQSWQRLRKPISDRKKSTAKGNWYTDLIEKIPGELKQEWYYSKILQKLASFGLSGLGLTWLDMMETMEKNGDLLIKGALNRWGDHMTNVYDLMSEQDGRAQVEGTGKQSIYKFLKVLQGLREWEICSPDISASIEYCRERIVEMTVEEYELWFKQQFPRVTRPQTAPPPSKTEKKDDRGGSSLTGKRPMRRPTQSAFARRVQH